MHTQTAQVIKPLHTKGYQQAGGGGYLLDVSEAKEGSFLQGRGNGNPRTGQALGGDPYNNNGFMVHQLLILSNQT